MFIPVKDDNPLETVRFQYVTVAILILNTVVFLFVQHGIFNNIDQAQTLSYGVVPAVLFGTAELSASLDRIPAELTLVSYMYLHGGWLHFIANMLFLWVFADNVEDSLGHFWFLVFYTVCGIGSGLVHALTIPLSQNPLIGASGAIAGVIGAYLILYPDRKVWVLLFFGIPLKIPALIVICLWVLTQVLSFAAGAYGETEVAWMAHISGFLIGLVLILVMRRKMPARSPDPET